VRKLVFGEGATEIVPLGCHTAAYVTDGRLGEVTRDAFESLTTAGMSPAAYPIRGRRTAAVFIHRDAARIEGRGPATWRREPAAAYRGRGGLLGGLLDVFPSHGDVYFDDVVQIRVAGWSRDRVVLVGDSCACVSLIAGQGASMAMAGAFVLAEQL